MGGLLEEGTFLGGGLKQGHFDLPTQHFCQNKPGKPCSGAQIGQGFGIGWNQGRQLG